ncbi:hypothetical protein [Thalassomonas haliotis]|uniref:Uncharacterized protein n=1 Tax=Thalassomonas haliotis TaxID=485448 RepID=A0ABY7V8N5_9GAMM|nr:hypothetical protein [Thalassomonas haliotis]WDE09871.1 hypothetical protein H3N35_16275 [Thalassomonas haliotis]
MADFAIKYFAQHFYSLASGSKRAGAAGTDGRYQASDSELFTDSGLAGVKPQ